MAETAADKDTKDKAAVADAQRTRDPATVETKSEADNRRGEKSDPRALRGAGYRRQQVAIEPGAAGEAKSPESSGDPVQEEGPVTLDEYVDKPSSSSPTAPGPFDTVDPFEHASSVTPDKGASARAGYGTVNAVVPIPDPSGREWADARKFDADVEERGGEKGGRTETYPATKPNGEVVTVWHNIDTGATKVLGPA